MEEFGDCSCDECALDLDSPNRGPAGIMKWNPQGEYWEFDSPLSPVEVRESTEEVRKSYSLRRYSDIFPDFKEGDIVTTSSDITNHDVFIHLRRSTKNQILPNGIYVVDSTSTGLILRPYSGAIDDYVALPHSVERLPEDMEKFFNNRSSYEKLGLRHKRGALVYGSPGNGKTLRIMKCAEEFVKMHDCYVFTLSGSIRTVDFLQYLVPVIASGKNNIVIMEEITERAHNDLQATLRFLDGDTSWNNSYIIATTNTPERLPANLIDRPGRFDILLEVEDPDDAVRKMYIEHFFGSASTEIVKETKGYSIAYIREMIIRSKLDGIPIEDTVKNMKDRKVKIKNQFKGDAYGRHGSYN